MVTWTIIGNIATTVGVVASIILGVRAERAAARRSEAAAALSDENARRAIDALERIAVSGADKVPERVEWAMTAHGGDTYLLENVGTARASKVSVFPVPDSNMVFRSPEVTDLGPGEALTFIAARTLATSNSTMTVTWNEEGHEPRWKYPLPPRPSHRA